ncbi:HD domain-containing protein [Flavihumibacter profundi]|uniref:HD domain-containing protein n=1 Tax=Flavihumibacter profundi TaxID=2716883 RepID=UPI001CC6245B|nr:HD domain-containing protein [Flavihumibacter profundi]MBZ5859258.1 HD domain-containing protein [Flavihumibacter profundi]
MRHMNETGFIAIEKAIIQRLTSGLDPRLTYHNLAHTLDVLDQALRIAVAEKITDPRQLMLIRIAALFHDTGFLFVYKGHEATSCEIMQEAVTGSSLTTGEIDQINGMIMATKIPQSPTCLMEEIICDADLDYLGRDDFSLISNNLKQEFLEYGVIKNELDWDPLQISFFEKHQYFTQSSKLIRAPKKSEHLAKLKEQQARISK